MDVIPTALHKLWRLVVDWSVVSDFPPPWPWFGARSGCVGFVADKWHWGRFPPSSTGFPADFCNTNCCLSINHRHYIVSILTPSLNIKLRNALFNGKLNYSIPSIHSFIRHIYLSTMIFKSFKGQSSRIRKWITCNVRYSLLYKAYYLAIRAEMYCDVTPWSPVIHRRFGRTFWLKFNIV
jgi:hypothetical protein